LPPAARCWVQDAAGTLLAETTGTGASSDLTFPADNGSVYEVHWHDF
jgi:hypothetical protein